jgi:hypothetical protein
MSFFNSIISLNNFFFFLILIIVFILSFKYGRKILISFILASYPTILIFNNLAFLKLGSSTAEIIILAVVYILSISILWTNLSPQNPHNTVRKLIDYGILSVSFMILVAGTTAQSLKVVKNFIDLGTMTTLINSYIPYAFALIIPIIAILITNKRSNY